MKFEAGQRRDQPVAGARARQKLAIERQRRVGIGPGDRGDPLAQFGLGQGAVPHRVVVEEEARLLRRAADHQRDVVAERGAGLGRVLCDDRTVDHRPEIVAVEQRIRARAGGA